MKALVVAPQPFFSPRGTPFSVYYRALVAAQCGVQIDLLTYGEGDDVVIPGVRIVRIPHFAMLGPVKVGPSFLKLFLDVFLMIWTVGMLLRRRYHFVHAHEEAVFWCRFLKPIFRFKLVYDMHSSLPQQLTNFQFTKSRLLIDMFRRLERTCLRSADAVVTICPDLRDYALSEGVDPNQHIMIENSIFDSVQLKKKEEPVDSTPVHFNGDAATSMVVYAGTFEAYQGVEMLVRAFAQVAQIKPDTRLVLAGGSSQQVKVIRQMADQLGLNGLCCFTGRVSKQEAMRFTQAADVLVSPRIRGTNTPLKLYEQLASGKPLVATRIWSHQQVLDEDACFMADPDPESFASAILAALEDHTRREQVIARAKSIYQKRYSRAAYEEKMNRLLELVR